MKNQLSDIEQIAAQKSGIRFYSSPEEKELAYLKEGLARSEKERFLYLLNLMKLERVMNKATFLSQ